MKSNALPVPHAEALAVIRKASDKELVDALKHARKQKNDLGAAIELAVLDEQYRRENARPIRPVRASKVPPTTRKPKAAKAPPVVPGPDIYVRWRADIKRQDWGQTHVNGDKGRGWRQW